MRHKVPWGKAAATALMVLVLSGAAVIDETGTVLAGTGPAVRTFHVGRTTITGTLRLFARPRLVALPGTGGARSLAPKSPAPVPAYQITNVRSGKCLEVYHALTGNLVNVDQYRCNGTRTQFWRFGLVGIFQGFPVYELINANSGRCADVYYSGTGNGVKVIQFTCKGSYNQYWIAMVVNGTYRFVNYNSGKVLEVFNGSLADLAQVDQWTDNGGQGQAWLTATSLSMAGPPGGDGYRLARRKPDSSTSVPVICSFGRRRLISCAVPSGDIVG